MTRLLRRTSAALFLVSGLAVFSAGTFAHAAPTTDSVDATQAQLGVNFSHAVPITVPEYFGIEPKLSVHYNVNGSVGLAGPGWSLGGFSTIERQSSFLGLPLFNATDRFLLDGQELISCVGPASSSPGCLMGGTHATKIESYSRIIRTANTFSVCKDGVCATYQPITCSTAGVYRWGISAVSDLLGHATNYTWATSNSCTGSPAADVLAYAYPLGVSYHGGQFTVAVYYENSLKAFPVSTGMGTISLAKRIKSLDVKVLGARKSAHQLSYQPGTDVLAKIQPYGTDAVLDVTGSITSGNTGLPAQTFIAGVPALSFGAATAAGTFACEQTGALSAVDIDGDGYTDFVCISAKTNSASSASSILVYKNNRNGTYAAATSVPYPDAKKAPALVDINCDRRPDLVWVSTTCPQQWRARLNSGAGVFSATETGWGNLPIDVDVQASAQFSDLNGDGCTDIVYPSTTGAPAVRSYKVMYGQQNTADTPTSTCLAASQPLMNLPVDAARDVYGVPLPLRVTDIDGSGSGDLVYFRNDNNITSAEVKAVLGSGYAMNQPTISLGLMSEFQNLSSLFFGRIASGRGSDMIYLKAGTAQLVLRPWDNGVQQFGAAQVLANAPTGTAILSLSTGDFNGDGRPDIVALSPSSATLMVPWVYLNQSTEPRLIEVRNGLGGYRKMTYANSASQPHTADVPAQMVVRTIVDSDGTQETTTTFDYARGLYDPADKRLVGFWKIDRTMSCVGTVCPRTTVYFDVDYTGPRPVRIDQTDSVTNKLWTSSVLKYALPAGIPYKTQLIEKWDYQYNTTSTGSRRTASSYTYETYGRIASEMEHGTGTTTLRLTTKTYTPMVASTYLSKQSRTALYDGPTPIDTMKLSETVNTFSATGLLTKREVWVSPVPVGASGPYIATTYDYDAQNRLIRTTAPQGRITTYEYEGQLGFYVSRVTNPANQVVQTTWSTLCGKPLSVVGANADYVASTYDTFCRPTLVQKYPGTWFERTIYVAAGSGVAQNTRIERPAVDGASGQVQWLESYFDGAGRPIEVRSRGPRTIVLRTAYNAHGQVASQSEPFYVGDPVYLTTYKYDALGRKTETLFPTGDTIVNAYTERRVCTTDEEGHQSCDEIDDLGNRYLHRELASSWISTNFLFTGRGEVRQITDALGNVTTFAYDSLGRKTVETDSVTGTTQTFYNQAGEVDRHVNALSETTAFTYDVLNRVKTRTSRSGTAQAKTVSYDYDTAEAGFSNVGQLTRENDELGFTRYRYNAQGKLAQKTRHFASDGDSPPEDQTFFYEYDASGRLRITQFPDGSAINTRDEAAGRPAVISFTPKRNVSPWVDLAFVDEEYRAAGQATKVFYGNSLSTRFNYHLSRHFLSDMKTTSALAPTVDLVSFVYGRNKEGRITSINQKVGAAPAVSIAYTHDARHQLLTAVSTPGGTQSWTYDNIGRLTASPLGTYCYDATTSGYPAPHAVRAVGTCAPQRYFYNAVGSLISGPITPNVPANGTRSLVYNGDAQVEQVSTVLLGVANPYQETYKYDARSARSRTTVSSGPGVVDFRKYYLGEDYHLARVGSPPVVSNLDIDRNGTADALSDGTLIMRYMFGFTGTSLVEGLVDPAGARTDPIEILAYLNLIRSSLDVDLNGSVDALTDGMVIQRSFFGFTGTALTNGVVDPAGQRTDPALIAAYLDAMNPQRTLPTTAVGETLTQTFSLGGLLVAKRVKTATTDTISYQHLDHLGSVVAESATTGTVGAAGSYLAYGKEPAQTVGSTSLQHRGYLGQLQDATGLLFLHARYYDAAVSQFISADPVRSAETTISLHPYAYSLNDPINRSDVSGEDSDGAEPGAPDSLGYQPPSSFNQTLDAVFDTIGYTLNRVVNRFTYYIPLGATEDGNKVLEISPFDMLASRGGLAFSKSEIRAAQEAIATLRNDPNAFYKFVDGTLKDVWRAGPFVLSKPKSAADAQAALKRLDEAGYRPLTQSEEVAALNLFKDKMSQLGSGVSVPAAKEMDGYMVREFVNGRKRQDFYSINVPVEQGAWVEKQMANMVLEAKNIFKGTGIGLDSNPDNFRFVFNAKTKQYDPVWLDPFFGMKK